MNLSHLTEKELVVYLDKHSTDPVVRRLVDIMMGKHEGLVTELVEVGMHPEDWEFIHDHQYYKPGAYIEFLIKELHSTEDELYIREREFEDLEVELRKLKARTVLEWMDELKEELRRSDYERDQARQERDSARISEQNMKSKMKVWRALTEDTTR